MRSNEQPKADQSLNGLPSAQINDRPTVTPAHPDKLIRIQTVCELTALGKTTIYSLPGFPKRVVLGRRAVGWRLSEVMQWMESRGAVGAKP